MTIALPKSMISIGLLPKLLMLFVALLIGGAGGYAVKGLTSAEPAIDTPPVSACAIGTHPVVWYTARAWACVRDGD